MNEKGSLTRPRVQELPQRLGFLAPVGFTRLTSTAADVERVVLVGTSGLILISQVDSDWALEKDSMRKA